MQEISVPRLIGRRLARDWALLLSVFLGVLLATSVVAGAPVYLKALDRLAFGIALSEFRGSSLSISVFASHILLSRESLGEAEQALAEAIDLHISHFHTGDEKYLRTSTFLAGHKLQPLPERGGTPALVSRGYFQHLSNLGQHSLIVEGRMAGDNISAGPKGPELEAVVGLPTGEAFAFEAGDVVTLTPSLGSGIFIEARIVGIVEPDDKTSDYWTNVGIFYDPAPLEERPDRGVQVNPDEKPVALFVTQDALIEAVGGSNPGTLVDPLWFILVDTERLKELPISEVRSRLVAFEEELTASLRGSEVLTGIIKGVLNNLNRKSFFSRLPLLLLIAIIVATLLFYVYMVVSYLVQNREADLALLRMRGVGTLRLLRLYGFEGALLAVLAVVAGPFLAVGAVALAGKLPFFTDITGGGTLPVELTPVPFLAALGIGLVCLLLFITLGLLGARGGLVLQKMRMSRPPTTPLFQRYYIDAALLALGGLVFWEFHSRGQIVSGGFFKDVEVDETLLLAPVLFLIAIALVFLRVFPLFVRFASGESQSLVHLLTAATLLVLAPGLAVRDIIDGNVTAWVGPVAPLLVLAALYWGTARAERLRYRVAGIILQIAPVAVFLALKPLSPDDVLFIPTIGLIGVVPAQIAFLLFKASTRSAPVWLSMGLWRMARNPMQYTWLVVLLLLATGLGILSTTVGGTLDRSQRERILYEVGADVRVSGISQFLSGGAAVLKERYLDVPGVDLASLGLRQSGSVGPTNVEVLALETREFERMTWYRDDFSNRPLGSVMGVLRTDVGANRLAIPAGATSIGLWAWPQEVYALMSMWVVVEDSAGKMQVITLGGFEELGWNLLQADITDDLEPPLYLTAVQVFEPGGGALSATAGAVFIDEIHVTVGPDNKKVVLEDFEGDLNWSVIVTSAVSQDVLSSTGDIFQSGRRSGVFTFGEDRNTSVRGFFRSPSGGILPVVASKSFLDASGYLVGDVLIAQVAGRQVAILVKDAIDYFPTLSPEGGGFIIADLDVLLGYLNILRFPSGIEPNELFLSTRPGAEEAVLEAMSELAGRVGGVLGRATRLESARMDPLTSLGWKALVFVSLGVMVLAAGSGYITYLVSSSMRGRGEIGFLQSMGLSSRQMAGLLGFEHLSISIVGLALGTWAGLRMSSLVVSSVTVTETGKEVIPPVLLVTDWGLLSVGYAALLGLIAVALFTLNRSVLRLDLNAIARLAD